MNSKFFLRINISGTLKISALLLVLLLTPGMRADSDVKTQANTLSNEYHAFVNNNTIQANMVDKINAEINELQNRADKLDALKAEIDALEMQVPDLESAYRNADSHASALENQLEGEKQNAKNRVNALLQQQNDICTQLGGTIQGQQCIFTCPQNNMGPCQSKLNSFDNQVAAIKSQLQSIVNTLQADAGAAQNARNDASAKNAEWEGKSSDLTEKKKDYDARREQYFTDATRIGNELDSAHIKPSLKGPAWQQANNVQHDPRNFDTFTGNVVISSSTANIPTPKVAEKSLPYKKAYDTASEELQHATERAEAADKALHAAEANHASQQELQELLKKSSEATSAQIWLTYQRSLLNGGTPKQSN